MAISETYRSYYPDERLGPELREYELTVHPKPVDSHVLFSFLTKEKDRLRDGKTNPVNYLAGMAKALVWTDTDANYYESYEEKYNRGFREVVDNMMGMIAEYPLAEFTKTESRSYQWENLDGEWVLKTPFGSMDDILSEALNSAQPLSFEIPRYEINRTNYETLKQYRSFLLDSQAISSGETFVEFSPSPIITPEAQKRGYLGKSTLFFFDFNPATGVETVRQRWLLADWNSFGSLFASLNLDATEPMDDLSIMRRSGFFSSRQQEAIETFIDTHNGRILNSPEILQFTKNELRPEFEEQIAPYLNSGAIKLLRGEDISEELKIIQSTLAYFQYILEKKIAEFSQGKTGSDKLDHYDVDRLRTDAQYRLKFVEENNIPLAGCGGSTSENNPFSQMFVLKGISMGQSLAGEDNYGSLEFECPVCGERHRRPYGKLLGTCISSQARFRGKEIPKC